MTRSGQPMLGNRLELLDFSHHRNPNVTGIILVGIVPVLA